MPRAKRVRDDVGDEDERPRVKTRSVVRGEEVLEKFRNLPLDIKEHIVELASGTWTSEKMSAMVTCEPLMARALAPAAILTGLSEGVLGTFWRSTLLQCCGEGCDDDRRLEEAFLHASFCLRLRSWARKVHAKRVENETFTPDTHPLRRIYGEVSKAQQLDNVVSWSEGPWVMSCVVFVNFEDAEQGKKPRVGMVQITPANLRRSPSRSGTPGALEQNKQTRGQTPHERQGR